MQFQIKTALLSRAAVNVHDVAARFAAVSRQRSSIVTTFKHKISGAGRRSAAA